jgi:O-methyltransferase
MILTRLLRNLFHSRVKDLPARPMTGVASVSLPKHSPPEPDRVPSFFVPVFWSTTDDKAFTEIMKSTVLMLAGGCHFADNFLTWGRNLSMLDDAPFVAAAAANAESASDQAIIWRRYVLACAAYHCVQLEGDFVECGAYTGVGVKTIVDYLGGPAFPKTFWAYDNFEHDASMLNHSMPEHSAGLYERVREKFAGYPQVRVVKGLIPEVFTSACPERIAYLHIDLNQAPAEVAALEALFDLLVPGGILVLDDYEWAGIYRSQKLAEDIWFEARKYRVMPLPTGQGIVIKR